MSLLCDRSRLRSFNNLSRIVLRETGEKRKACETKEEGTSDRLENNIENGCPNIWKKGPALSQALGHRATVDELKRFPPPKVMIERDAVARLLLAARDINNRQRDNSDGYMARAPACIPFTQLAYACASSRRFVLYLCTYIYIYIYTYKRQRLPP